MSNLKIAENFKANLPLHKAILSNDNCGIELRVINLHYV
jgi:hypothetical protein